MTVTTTQGTEVVRRPGFDVTVAGPSAPSKVTVAEVAQDREALTSKGTQRGGGPVSPTDSGAVRAGIDNVNRTATTAIQRSAVAIRSSPNASTTVRNLALVAQGSTASPLTLNADARTTDAAVQTKVVARTGGGRAGTRGPGTVGAGTGGIATGTTGATSTGAGEPEREATPGRAQEPTALAPPRRNRDGWHRNRRHAGAPGRGPRPGAASHSTRRSTRPSTPPCPPCSCRLSPAGRIDLADLRPPHGEHGRRDRRPDAHAPSRLRLRRHRPVLELHGRHRTPSRSPTAARSWRGLRLRGPAGRQPHHVPRGRERDPGAGHARHGRPGPADGPPVQPRTTTTAAPSSRTRPASVRAVAARASTTPTGRRSAPPRPPPRSGRPARAGPSPGSRRAWCAPSTRRRRRTSPKTRNYVGTLRINAASVAGSLSGAGGYSMSTVGGFFGPVANGSPPELAGSLTLSGPGDVAGAGIFQTRR